MGKIQVNIDETEEYIILVGAIDELSGNRFANRYIKGTLKAEIVESEIRIPLNEEKSSIMLEKISSMLKKYGFEEEHAQEAEQIIIDFFEEEAKFQDFSKNALDIRNNNCKHNEFENFINSVCENLKNRTLYELQLLSAYHLAFSQNACNFSVPGAGKTSVVYGAYAYLKNLNQDDIKKIDRILIIGPLSSFGPWELEYEECFGIKPITKRLVSSIKKQEKVDYLYSSNTAEITLISYASVSTISDALVWYLKNNRVMVVLDEAHKIKNTSGGENAEAVLRLAPYCKSRVVLTGTPAPNGYDDLFNLFKFIWPTKNIMGFQVNQLRDMSNKHNDARISRLISSISPYFIRIRKSDLHLPELKMHPPIIVPMGDYQRRIYDVIEKKYIESIIENREDDLSDKFKKQLVSAKLIRLMQAATNPSLLGVSLNEFLYDEDISLDALRGFDDTDLLNQIVKYADNEVPAKFCEVKKLVDEIINKNGKVVIWASFVKNIHDLKIYLEKNGIKCQELYGAIPVEQEDFNSDDDIITREKIVRDFQNEDSDFKVIIANPFAVAESISLHKACHNAIYLERTFNAAHYMQSKDRIHRYGLKAGIETNYYFLLSQDSIDETINERLNIKEHRMTEIMESMPIPLFDNVIDGLGDADVKAMIKDYVRRTKGI